MSALLDELRVLAHRMWVFRFFGRAPNPQNVEAHEKALEGRLSGYEVLLSKTKYVAGDVSRPSGERLRLSLTSRRITLGAHAHRSLSPVVRCPPQGPGIRLPGVREVPQCR